MPDRLERQLDPLDGPVAAFLSPAVVAGCDPPMRVLPGFREHPGSVLAELGLDRGGSDALRAAGTIGPAYREPRAAAGA
ncbi:hypothetical protein E4P41_17715 [Geodermatophilus sp. DF01-2]|uniref:hypothetical protein n=1 Tax=Geodermatophilus sp. DF01-2 TaxID=2559610 RepID=UPI001072FA58|nr:hypothetical protein [Geodermatophilus sp. DF01_2]TFV55133.1 hypothetical protein E4P41_17715 [Geodermatophilus sp. DF01_2]